MPLTSRSKCVLEVSCSNPLAELTILNGRLKKVHEGYTPLNVNVPDGIYLVRARLGVQQTQRSIMVRQRSLMQRESIAAPTLDSPLQYLPHLDRDTNATAQAGDEGRGTLILRLCTAPVEYNDFISNKKDLVDPAGLADPNGELLLMNDAGRCLAVLWNIGEIESHRFSRVVMLDPGVYKVVYRAGRIAVCMRIIVVAGMTLTCLLTMEYAGSGRWRPNFPDMGILYNKHVDHSREVAELAESLRVISLAGRACPDTPTLRDFLRSQRCDAMSALYAGYMLLHESRERPGQLEKPLALDIFTRAKDELGSHHADVATLACALRQRFTSTRLDIPEPTTRPMLQASWDWLLESGLIETNQALVEACEPYHDVGGFLRWSMSKNEKEMLPPVASGLLLPAGVTRLHADRDPILPGFHPPRSIRLEVPKRRPTLVNLAAKYLPAAIDHLRSTAMLIRGKYEALPPVEGTGGQAALAAMADRVATQLRSMLSDPQWSQAISAAIASGVLMRNVDAVVQELVLVLRGVMGNPHAIKALNGAYIIELARSMRLPVSQVSAAVHQISDVAKIAVLLMRGPGDPKDKPPRHP